jgi:hypothetical protein
MNTTDPNFKPTVADGFSITAMVLGIVGAFFFWFYAIMPVLAIIFGAIALSKQRQANVKPSGMAIAGLVLGAVFTGIFVLVLILAVALA